MDDAEDFALLNGEIEWSSWTSFSDALHELPLEPGVYEVRQASAPNTVYVGSAGRRDGGGNRPARGLRGRFERYASGKALASGLGEAVFDRALSDPVWLRERLGEVESGMGRRAAEWGVLAFERASLEVRWVTTPDKLSAEVLEKQLIQSYEGLWNRRLHRTQPKGAKARRVVMFRPRDS